MYYLSQSIKALTPALPLGKREALEKLLSVSSAAFSSVIIILVEETDYCEPEGQPWDRR